MPTEFSTEILTSALAQIVESVFETMMSLEVTECETPWFPSGDRLTSALHLAGEWNGAVLLECDRRQACRFAGRFLSLDPPGTVDDVVRDLLGELANMICGNLKSTLAPGAVLAMPEVVAGEPSELVGEPAAERCSFSSDDGPFCVVSFRKPR